MSLFIQNNKINFLLAFAFALSFFIYNFFLLSNGHFHEDAYILFIYVDNFLNGHGITFYPGGNPTEGATDFLWLILLILLGKSGIDAGTSAIILNSLGVFLITLILTTEILKSKCQSSHVHVFLLLFAFLWLFNQPLIAAAGGFSVFLYMSFILLAFVAVKSKRYLLLTPYISIVIALFRPDGVIIAVLYTLIGLFYAYEIKTARKYLLGMGFGFIVGAIYFLWRFDYFQNLLPLPLYVKSHGSLLSGAHENIGWLIRNLHFVIPVFLLAALHKKVKYYLTLSLPVIILFIALFTATQSQNFGYRFQAPVFIVLYYILIKLVIDYFRTNRSNAFTSSLLFFYLSLMVINSIYYLKSSYYSITSFNYANKAPLDINHLIPENSTIALTEAGRMAYWNQTGGHKIIDLVGLNTEYPAKNTISTNYIYNLNPDLIMYHHADLLDVEQIANNSRNSYVVEIADYAEYPLPYKNNESSPSGKTSKVNTASLVASEFLRKEFHNYDIFFVDNKQNRSYSHIYAIKKEHNLKVELYKTLASSFKQDETLSYYEMINIQ